MGLAGFGITGPWAWIGIVPLLTGMIGNCPAYSLLGISTAKKIQNVVDTVFQQGEPAISTIKR